MALLITKLPNFFLLVCVFITTSLLCFLLAGCYNTANSYSSIYITKFEYNDTTHMDISFNGTSSSSSNVTNFSIGMGYLSFCIYLDKTVCTTYENINRLQNYPVVAVQTSEGDGSLDLVSLAIKFSKICFPWVLMATIIITILLLIISIWLALPFVSAKTIVRQAACGMSLVLVLIWGLGSMLQHEAATATECLVPVSSMELITVHKGKKAEAITWTAFGFFGVILIGNLFMMFKERKQTKLKDMGIKY